MTLVIRLLASRGRRIRRPRVRNSHTVCKRRGPLLPIASTRQGRLTIFGGGDSREAGWRERVDQHQESLKKVTGHDGSYQRKYRASVAEWRPHAADAPAR